MQISLNWDLLCFQIFLLGFDDKRYILDDGVGSLVYFQRGVFG